MTFIVKEGIALGQKILGKGFQVDQPKLKVIVYLPQPISMWDVWSFLGYASFYRQFTMAFSKIAHPLCKILEK